MILVARRKETGYNIMKYKDEGGRLCRLFTMEAEWLWNNPRSAFKNSIRIFTGAFTAPPMNSRRCAGQRAFEKLESSTSIPSMTRPNSRSSASWK